MPTYPNTLVQTCVLINLVVMECVPLFPIVIDPGDDEEIPDGHGRPQFGVCAGSSTHPKGGSHC
jgi:hypothetical protein